MVDAMGFIDLDITEALGQRILTEKKLTGKVTAVRFKVDGHTGWSEYTPADFDYPVEVDYIDPHDGKHTVTKTYRYLSDIVKVLEDIDDDKFD
jgi:hypothetical protein